MCHVLFTRGISHQTYTPDPARQFTESGTDFERVIRDKLLPDGSFIYALWDSDGGELRQPRFLLNEELESHGFKSELQCLLHFLVPCPRVFDAFLFEQAQRLM